MLAAGLTDCDPDDVGDAVVDCWDAFLDLVGDPATDLGQRSRLKTWTGRDLLVHLGTWDDNHALQGITESAEAGGAGQTPQVDRENATLIAAHADATREQVVGAVRQSRDITEEFFADGTAARIARLTSRSSLGPLPVLSLVHAACYELAVHALDLAPCGAPAPSPLLLDRGLAALIDVTGALASRSGVSATVTAQAPDGGWQFTSDPEGWRTERLPAGRYEGAGVSGSTPDLLDVSAGRTNLPQVLLARRLVVQDLAGFMRLAPLLQEVPGLPGGAALRAGVAGLGKVRRLLHLR